MKGIVLPFVVESLIVPLMVAAPIVVFIVMAQNNNSNSFFIVCFKLFPLMTRFCVESLIKRIKLLSLKAI